MVKRCLRRLIGLFVFLLSAGCLSAQPNTEVWIIGGPKYLGEGFKTFRLDVAFDGRNSFSEGNSVRVGGFRIGAEYNRIHRFGIGVYEISAPARQSVYQNNDTLFGPASLTLNYRSLYYERVLFFNPKWELSGTAHLARGSINVNKPDELSGRFTFYETIDVNPIELSTSAYHHLSWWLSAGFGVGYRWMLNTPEEIVPLYNSTVYLAKVKVRVGKAVRTVWNKSAKYEY